MTKQILVILVTLFSVACGGEPFTNFGPVPPDGAGGSDAGAGDVTPAGGSVAVAGAGGYTAGSSGLAGATVGGSAGAGGTSAAAGSGAVSCDKLSDKALTGALPKTIKWHDFSLNDNGTCAECLDDTCGTYSIEWDEPIVKGNVVTYNPVFHTSSSTRARVRVANSECSANASGVVCDAELPSVSVIFAVERSGSAWQAEPTSVAVGFADNDCTSSITSLSARMAIDLQQEIHDSLVDLKFPCN